jgi:hypothetical protein
MAKYKLIKKFPGSASLGTVIDTDDVAFGITHNYTDYPEFWEKVVEKDWEILNQGYNGLIGKWEIKAVKRKCDGEIFSVGDKLDFRDGEVRKITGISLDDTGVSEFSKRSIPWLECGKDYGTCLDWAIHYKEPTLITEDGVKILKGDECWACDKATLRDLGKVDWKNAHPFKEGLYFSTREAAEKYIEENKPMYSKKDMLSFGASMSSTLYPYQCEGCLEQWKKFKKGE